MTLHLGDTLSAVRQALDRYHSAEIDQTVSAAEVGMADPSDEIVSHYRRVGAGALDVVLSAMVLSGRTTFGTILDMPCGYGRVTRHLRAAFPDAEITVSDIDPDMVAFCARQFGCLPAMSENDFRMVEYPTRYDLIWSGSLFTHLPERKFQFAFDLLSRSLAPGGVAIMTTHGRYSAEFGRGNYLPADRFLKAEREYNATGFGYVNYCDDLSIYTDNYGITLSSPTWVAECACRDISIRIIGVTERGWTDHQDVWMFQKRPILG